MDSKSVDPDTKYFEAWKQLAERIRHGQSFSGRERNCCFLNTHSARWADVSAAFGLDLLDDSRAIASVDWDHDGDLDLWVTNRTGPRVRYLRNDLPRNIQSSSFGIALRGNPSRHCPADAVGARVEVTWRAANGQLVHRIQTLTAGDGFLSQSSKVLHFGSSGDEQLMQVSVRWPGSNDSETWTNLEPGKRYLLEQGHAVDGPRLLASRPPVRLMEPHGDRTARTEDEAPSSRVWLSVPLAMQKISYQSLSTDTPQAVPQASGRPKLVTLWASWCQPCLQELSEWSQHADAFERERLDVIALSVEGVSPNTSENVLAAKEMAATLNLPFTTGLAPAELIQQLDDLKKQVLYRDDPLPLPASFLIDSQGQLRTIYAGPATWEQILEDVAHLHLSGEANRDRAVPFAGRWAAPRFVTNPIAIATIFREERQFDEARNYLQEYLDKHSAPPGSLLTREAMDARRRLADVHHLLGRVALDVHQLDAAQNALRRSLELYPKHWSALMDLGEAYQRAAAFDSAERMWMRALELQANHPRTLNQLGLLNLQRGKATTAATYFQQAVAAQEDYFPAANNLAWMWSTHQDANVRNGKESVALAERLLNRLGPRADLLDTLAAAYAENGSFEKAIETATEAIKLAMRDQQPALAKEIEGRLDVYRHHQPFRTPSPEPQTKP